MATPQRKAHPCGLFKSNNEPSTQMMVSLVCGSGLGIPCFEQHISCANGKFYPDRLSSIPMFSPQPWHCLLIPITSHLGQEEYCQVCSDVLFLLVAMWQANDFCLALFLQMHLPGQRWRGRCSKQMAVGQNQWYHFGIVILVYFRGDWDVHWGCGILTHTPSHQIPHTGPVAGAGTCSTLPSPAPWLKILGRFGGRPHVKAWL